MSRSEHSRAVPRAVIHRQILDVAETSPDASLTAIAREVSGASPTLVERVFDEYGDPATDPAAGTTDESDAMDEVDTGAGDEVDADVEDDVEEEEEDDVDADVEDGTGGATGDGVGDEAAEEMTDGPTTTDGPAGTDAHSKPDTEDEIMDGNATTDSTANGTQTNGDSTRSVESIALSDRQRRTLRVLADDPDATQGDVAERLGVTRPTVSRRLNSIPGFDWTDRRSFVASVFEESTLASGAVDDATDASDSQDAARETDADSRSDLTSDRDAVQEATGEDVSPADGDGDLDGADERRPELDEVEKRLAALEAGTAAETAADEPTGDADEERDGDVTASIEVTPEFAYKILRACQESDHVTEDEERDLLRSLMHR